jgi:hypothetical protein
MATRTRIATPCPKCKAATEGYSDWMRNKRSRWCPGCGWEGDVDRQKTAMNGSPLSDRMLEVIQQHCPNEPLEHWLARTINEIGVTNTCRLLDLSDSAVNLWCKRLGIDQRRIAVPPGYRLRVVKE